MQRTKSKILSILLSLVMLLSLLPTTALAAGNYPNSVRVYNGIGTFTTLSDGLCLATNGATSATKYTAGSPDYVARYEASSGTLYLNGYQNDYQYITPSSVIFADGDLNIEVVSDSSFSTSVSATDDLRGIQANGKLNISGPGKLTVTANGDGDVYGIYADKGVTISAPLEVNVGKAEEDSSKNGPVCGIYAQSGTISLSGNDMTITATGGNEAAYGVYNQAQTSSSAAGSSNITITGKLTVNLNKGRSNVGIYTGNGGTITLDGATVIIPKNFNPGIFNNNGNVIIKNNSNVTLTSDVSGSWGVYAKYGGDLIIENSTVKVSADSLAACLKQGNVSIKDSKVELTSTYKHYKHYEVIRTGNSSLENTIDLSGSGSVTLTVPDNQTGSMITGGVTLVGSTKCVKGTEYDYGSYKNYDGEYDKANNITVLQFVHEDSAPTTNISVSGTVKSYGDAGEKVTVTLTPTAGGTPLTPTLTGAAGTAPYSQNYTFAAVPAGTYTLKVEKKGHAPWTENITVGTDDITGKNVTIYLIGDVDGNGKVEQKDSMILSRYFAGWSGYETKIVSSAAADVDQNGELKLKDSMILSRYFAGWSEYTKYFQ